MSNDVRNIINVVGIALILGLLLRYSSQAVDLLNAGGSQISSLYRDVSLQSVGSPK